MDLEVTRTTVNLTALLGWAALLLGIIATVLVVAIEFTVLGAIGASAGLIGGAITITNTGPLRKVERVKVKMRERK